MTNKKSYDIIVNVDGRESMPKKLFKKVLKKVLTNRFECVIIFKSLQVTYGSIAQLGEHLPYKQRVIGSSPIVPTIRPGSSVG